MDSQPIIYSDEQLRELGIDQGPLGHGYSTPDPAGDRPELFAEPGATGSAVAAR